MTKLAKTILGAVVLAAFGFGAEAAYAARNVLRDPICDEWNWCAPSRGGPDNCNECCELNEYTYGVCFSEAETEWQGCVCCLEPPGCD
jgi:hypothetical protein